MKKLHLGRTASSVLAVLAMFGAALFGAPAAMADDVPTIGHNATITDNGDGSYTLNYSVAGKPMDETIDGTASDVIMLMDVSGSMDGNPWEIAKSATENLASALLDKGNDIRMAIVPFSSTAQTQTFGPDKAKWTTSSEEVKQTLAQVDVVGLTNWEQAFINAKFLIGEQPARKAYVVMMSDGSPNVISTCDPIREDCTSYDSSSGVTHTVAYDAALKQAKTLPNTQIYAVSTDEWAGSYMSRLVEDINAANPPYPSKYFDGKDQASLNAAFGTIAQEILKRYKNVTIDATLSELVDPVLPAGSTDPVEAAGLSDNAVKAGATLTYDEATRSYTVAFPEGMEITDTYTVSIRIRPNQQGLDAAAASGSHTISTGSATISYQLATTTGGNTDLSEVHTVDVAGPQITLASEPVTPDTPDEQPEQPQTPAEPKQKTVATTEQIAQTGSPITGFAIAAALCALVGAMALAGARSRQ